MLLTLSIDGQDCNGMSLAPNSRQTSRASAYLDNVIPVSITGTIQYESYAAYRAFANDFHLRPGIMPQDTTVRFRNPENIDDFRDLVMEKWVGVEQEPVKWVFSQKA